MSALIPLVAVWLLVLVPPVIRSHLERRREFIDSFHRQLGALEASRRSSGIETAVGPAPGVRRRSAAHRRRTVLVGLLLSMLATLLPLLVFPSKLALVVHLAVDDCFLLYLALLAWRRAPGSLALASGSQACLQ